MWDALREQGCTLAQGYLISKPASAEDLAPLLADRARPPQQPGRAGLRASKAPAALRAKSSTGRRPRSHSSLPTR
jgi:predicted signal transduction protein with EAL and GGDEF domain